MEKNEAAWRSSRSGIAKYRAARAEAQAAANRDGFDRGLEANDLFRSWHVFMLPKKSSRVGHELRCEIVSFEDLSRCADGHGHAGVSPK
jgi:hypothetical protein